MSRLCSVCQQEMELVDTTYSNMNSSRCNEGDHTGDIYECKAPACEDEPLYIEDFLSGDFYEWSYS